MKNNRGLRAFSLIEISIVLLIIGILVAGVTQSSRLISQSKINSARAMTQSSPVSSIKNLVLWIEATSEASFDDAETDDALTLTNWYDINPQSSVKSSFTQATTANKPVYKKNIINGLPAVLFTIDGTTAADSDFMQSTNFANIVTGSSTIFVVFKTPATPAAGTILSKRIAGGDTGTNLEVQTTAAGGALIANCASLTADGTISCKSSTATTAINTSYIVSATFINSTASTGSNIYVAGGSAAPAAATTNDSIFITPTTTDYLYLGKQGLTSSPVYLTAYIGEVIIYERVLKTEERKAVEAYLGKKWGIAVS